MTVVDEPLALRGFDAAGENEAQRPDFAVARRARL